MTWHIVYSWRNIEVCNVGDVGASSYHKGLDSYQDRVRCRLSRSFSTWASPENPMWKFLYKTTTAGSKDLPRKVAMVLAKGTLDFTKEVS